MGKIILEFDSYEERQEAETAANGWKYRSALTELDQELRGLTKHAPDSMSPDTYAAYEHARQLLRDVIHDNGLTLD